MAECQFFLRVFSIPLLRFSSLKVRPLLNLLQLSDILDEINECLEEFQIAEAPIRTKAVNVMHTVSGMKAKLSMGVGSSYSSPQN